jgi:chitin synthase
MSLEHVDRQDVTVLPFRPVSVATPSEIPREFALDRWDASELKAFMDPENICCITLYNEKKAVLQETLSTLILSLRQFHSQVSARTSFSTICIIADGMEKVDPSVIEFFSECGLLNKKFALKDDNTDFHFTRYRPDVLLKKISGLDQVVEQESLETIRIIVCLKHSNRGKLHSHAMFFGAVCGFLQPKYCYQIDAGTTLAIDSIEKLVARMESNPDIAALAPKIMTRSPAPGDGLLATWQYFDFALQKCLLWPFEAATGHLSVIPGQACIFRWQALSTGRGYKTHEKSVGLIKAYLRGLDAKSAMERIMYLAEDRVIGNEIALARQARWRLGYAPDAGAITDSCDNLKELLRQRRRWINSAMACRLWLLARWPDYLRRPDKSKTDKVTFSVSLLAQVYLILRECLAPAQLVSFVLVLWQALGENRDPLARAMHNAFWAMALVVLLFIAARPRRFFGANQRLFEIVSGILYSATGVLMAAGLALTLPLAGNLILFSPLLVYFMMMFVLPGTALTIGLRGPAYVATDAVMVNLLWSYSLWNLHDVSWGTKGLTRSATEGVVHRRLKFWRNCIFSSWILLNLTVLAAQFGRVGLISKSLNPVVEFFCLTTLLATAVVAVGLLVSKWSVAWKHLRRRGSAILASFQQHDAPGP